jgi:two-component sensor histidine kinase
MGRELQRAVWDEGQRLAELDSFEILDTPPEPDFDDLVLLIAQICEAPRAAINLIGSDRQWFKAEVGLGLRETSLDISICAQILLQPGLTIIPDVRSDARSSSNPLVIGDPHIRFYAGVLLETSEGIPLGTLCVLDDDVRDLSPTQAFALTTIARQVMALLELRRALGQRDRALAAREEAEARGTLLTRELHHRVKNTLATVQAVASSTARSTASVHDFQAALSGRIGSLAKAHAVITGDEAQSASVLDLVRLELDGFSEGRTGRVTINGPDVRLPSEIAIPLGLAIHELAVNSARFGALSVADGRVSVSWDYDSTQTLVLRWVEHDGPKVDQPGRQGFGTRVLERVLGGQQGVSVDLEYAPAGLRVVIDLPLQ